MSYSGKKGWITKPKPGVRIDPLHLLSRGVVACWLFNEGAGSKTCDTSGYGHHGTLADMDPPTDWVGSLHGGGLDFDGGNDRILLPDIRDHFSDEATLIMWLKLRNDPPPVGAQTGFAYLGTSASSSHYPYTDGVIYLDTFRTARVTVGAGAVDRAEWHLLAVTTKPGANGWKVYQNEIEIFSGAGEAAVSLPAAPIIGQGKAGRNIEGLIDEVWIWNRALSASEIEQHYRDPYCNLLRVPIRRYFQVTVRIPRPPAAYNTLMIY